MAHHSQEGAFRLVGCFGGSPGLLYCFHRLLALRDIQIKGKNPDLPTFYYHRSTQDFHNDKSVILAPSPGKSMNDLPLLGAGLVAAGFGTMLWRAHQFIQVAPKNLNLRVAEQLLKGRVAGHNRVIKVRTDYGDGA